MELSLEAFETFLQTAKNAPYVEKGMYCVHLKNGDSFEVKEISASDMELYKITAVDFTDSSILELNAEHPGAPFVELI